jgi:hypothetical protein
MTKCTNLPQGGTLIAALKKKEESARNRLAHQTTATDHCTKLHTPIRESNQIK